MNTWIPKNNIVRLAATVLLVSIILYFAGLFITLRQIKKVEDLYNNAESGFSKNEKFLAIKSAVEENQDAIIFLRSFFVSKDDEVKFIEQIEDAAKNSGIKSEIASIDVKPSTDKTSLKEDVMVKINIEGQWKNMMTFVDKLEKLPFGVSINKINLDTSGKGLWSGSVDFIIFREK
jgi:Tfp pilus assembly protein PilO